MASPEPSLSDLIEQARGGDASAWSALVGRLANLVWSITRSFGLGVHDAADVSQIVWLQLARSIGDLHDPERVGLWLATCARRECLRLLDRTSRIVAVNPVEMVATCPDVTPSVEDTVVQREERRMLWDGLPRLPHRCRALVRLLLADPQPSYAELSAALDIPVNSVGPTRQRCLAQLRSIALAGGRGCRGGGL